MTRLAIGIAFLSFAAIGVVAQATKPTASAPTRVAIAITENGFEPESILVRRGEPVTLVFTRKTDVTCAKDVLIRVDDKTSMKKELPLGTPIEIPLLFPRAGKLRYACGMDMLGGIIDVQ